MTHAGKVRERNEDSCLVRTDVGLWAVADGMGGHEAGDLASRILVESLNAIEQPEAALDLLEQCEAQIFRANQQIMDLSRARNGATIGTTAAVLLVRDKHYACVWAGDSRVYLINGGAIKQLSRDHTEVEELVAAGTLSREDAEKWPQQCDHPRGRRRRGSGARDCHRAGRSGGCLCDLQRWSDQAPA